MEKWYAIYTRPKHENKVYDQLVEKDIEAFLPLVPRIRIWKDRKKKLMMPMFTSYLFAYFDYKNRFDVLHCKGVVKIVNFRGKPAVVPEWQISSLKRMLEFPDQIVVENYVRPGEIVRVIAGPFFGMQGMVKEIRGTNRLVVSIDGIMQAVSVGIDTAQVERVKNVQDSI
ncbi:MAG: UpxY family transcription antiterminator [Caldithrix sp.]|nr:UpxY family transcription antiterminator [Caldithrix sp.]